MRSIRSVVPLTILLASCSFLPKATPPVAPAAYGIGIADEARILRLEDRREFDRTLAESWMRHENPLHRERMTMALAHISPYSFDDRNGNGELDEGELPAGIELLIAASADPKFEVRRAVAFALGEVASPAGVDALLTLAQDQAHADVAAEAVEALSKLAKQIPLERYRPLTEDPRPGVRSRALRFLFRFGTDEAMSIAARALDATDVNVRREAAYALSRAAHAPARAAIELLLTDSDTLTRSFAARALGLIGDPQSFAPLMQHTTDVHPWVRTNVIRSLTQIAEKNAGTIGARSVAEDLLRVIALVEDADPGVRAVAIELLGSYATESPRARDRLREIATSGAAVECEIASGTLAKRAEGGDGLDALVSTDQPWVKLRVIEATATTASGVTLREQFFSDESAMVRAAAVSAVPSAAVDAELALVRKAMEDADVVVRSAAIEKFAAASAVPLEEKVRALSAAEQAARSDSMNDARIAAMTALSDLDYPEREAFLREALKDGDPMVRRYAADFIAEKLKKARPQYTPLPVDRPVAEYEAIARWSQENHTAVLRTTRGAIELSLLTRDAPITTWNFATLAKRGYFDGTTFMRVVPNFVVQGGDPRNDQSGGPGYSIRDEINLQKYTRGAVGMALSGPDTGGSQFFITHSPQPHLDGTYTIFGRVTGGMSEVVDRIERGDKVEKIEIDPQPVVPAPGT